MNTFGSWLINFTMLKAYGASCLNRDDNNEPKQQVIGGFLRSRISSAALKSVWRREMENGTSYDIHTAHIQDCVEEILKEMAKNGTITEKEIDYYGSMICTGDNKTILDADWKKRSSVKNGENEKDKEEKKEKDKKFTITVVSPAELLALINAVIDCDKKNKELEKGVKPVNPADAAKTAVENVQVSLDKAMFGTMATAGVLESVDGAVYVSDAYSIDEYKPEYDYHTASFYQANVSEGDAFFEGFHLFNQSRKKAKGAETIASSWLNSNTMLIQTGINLSDLKKNIARGVSDTDTLADSLAENVAEYARTIVTIDPEANQHGHYSKPLPDILYFEITNGQDFTVDGSFNKIVRGTEDKSVTETGVERILNYSEHVMDFDQPADTVRKRYVFLGHTVSNYEEKFKNVGVTVLHNLKEVSETLSSEVKAVM